MVSRLCEFGGFTALLPLLLRARCCCCCCSLLTWSNHVRTLLCHFLWKWPFGTTLLCFTILPYTRRSSQTRALRGAAPARATEKGGSALTPPPAISPFRKRYQNQDEFSFGVAPFLFFFFVALTALGVYTRLLGSALLCPLLDARLLPPGNKTSSHAVEGELGAVGPAAEGGSSGCGSKLPCECV